MEPTKKEMEEIDKILMDLINNPNKNLDKSTNSFDATNLSDDELLEFFRNMKHDDTITVVSKSDMITKRMCIELNDLVDDLKLDEVGRSDFFQLFKQCFGYDATEKDYETWLDN